MQSGGNCKQRLISAVHTTPSKRRDAAAEIGNAGKLGGYLEVSEKQDFSLSGRKEDWY